MLDHNAQIFFPDEDGLLGKYMDELEENSKRIVELKDVEVYLMTPDPEKEIDLLLYRCRMLREVIAVRTYKMLRRQGRPLPPLTRRR